MFPEDSIDAGEAQRGKNPSSACRRRTNTQADFSSSADPGPRPAAGTRGGENPTLVKTPGLPRLLIFRRRPASTTGLPAFWCHGPTCPLCFWLQSYYLRLRPHPHPGTLLFFKSGAVASPQQSSLTAQAHRQPTEGREKWQMPITVSRTRSSVRLCAILVEEHVQSARDLNQAGILFPTGHCLKPPWAAVRRHARLEGSRQRHVEPVNDDPGRTRSR